MNYSNGGFGNTKEQEQETSDFWGSVSSGWSSGWSSFTETASNLAANASERAQKLGNQFQENVWKPTKEKVRRKLESIMIAFLVWGIVFCCLCFCKWSTHSSHEAMYVCVVYAHPHIVSDDPVWTESEGEGHRGEVEGRGRNIVD